MDRDLAEYLEILGFSPTPFGSTATAKVPAPATAMSSPNAVNEVAPSPLCVVIEDSCEGAAQDLLFKMLAAMGLKPESVFITQATTNLETEIAARHPRALLALGAAAGEVLLQGAAPLSQFANHPRLRGEDGEPLPVMTTVALRDLLATPALKKNAWADLQLVMPRLHERPS